MLFNNILTFNVIQLLTCILKTFKCTNRNSVCKKSIKIFDYLNHRFMFLHLSFFRVLALFNSFKDHIKDFYTVLLNVVNEIKNLNFKI